MITNYLFVINTLMYCYYFPDKIKPKIFYFPLEEDKEAITLKIMAFVLNHITKGELVISPTDLLSTNEGKPLSEEILTLMNSEQFIKIMDLYENMVTFLDDTNRVGIYKVMYGYAKAHGEIHYKKMLMNEVDDFGNTHKVEREVFDYYTPNNPDEYVICIIDHISLDLNRRAI